MEEHHRGLVAVALATILVTGPAMAHTGEAPALDDGYEDGDLDEYVEHVETGDWSIVENGIDDRSVRVEYSGNPDPGPIQLVDPDEFCIAGDREISVDFQSDTSHWKKNAWLYFGSEDALWSTNAAVQGDSMALHSADGRLKKVDVGIDDGAVHELSVSITEDSVAVQLDGTTHIEVGIEEPVPPGTVGIGNRAGSISIATTFDNLQAEGEACPIETTLDAEPVVDASNATSTFPSFRAELTVAEDGHAVPDQQIDFYVEDGLLSEEAFACSAETDEDGVAECGGPTDHLNLGPDATVHAVFAGEHPWMASEDEAAYLAAG
jgi:hypothetical protein